MRTFVAITTPPSGSVPKYLNDCRYRLERDRPDVKWVAAAHRHITVRFLGELSVEELDAVREAIARTAASCVPFDARLVGWGAFPTASRPQTIWVGVDGLSGAFQSVERVLASELRALGILPDVKPFHPHITLGRVRSARGALALAKALKLPPPRSERTSFVVDGMTLFESVLTPTGPRYTVLLKAGFSMIADQSVGTADAETTIR